MVPCALTTRLSGLYIRNTLNLSYLKRSGFSICCKFLGPGGRENSQFSPLLTRPFGYRFSAIPHVLFAVARKSQISSIWAVWMLVGGNPARYRLQESSDFAFFPIFANFCNSGVVEIFSFHRFGKGVLADNFSHFANLGRVQFRTRYRPQKPYDFAFLQYFTTREWRRFLRRVAFNALFTLT